jgi:hypothetical protein
MRTRRGVMRCLLSHGYPHRFRMLLKSFRPLFTLKPPSTRTFPAAFSGGLMSVDLVGHRTGPF